MDTGDVIVIGGGAVGCAAAYFLAKDGARVTLLEKDAVASAASGYAMGLLSPLSGAGIPGPLEELSLQGFYAHRDLAAELKEATGVDYHARPQDSLNLAFSEEDARGLEVIADYCQKVDGVSSRWLDGSDVMALEPRISPSVWKGLLIEGAWLLDADLYTRALAEAARRLGADVRQARVTGLKRSGSNLSVQTSDGSLEAGSVVLALGPWAGDASSWLGVPVPISPLKGQILRMDIPGPPPACSLNYASNYAGAKADGLVWIGTTEERVGFDDRPTEEARAAILRSVAAFFPPVAEGTVARQTACLRPVAPDGLPIIGGVAGWDGVYLATGAGRKGIVLSPSMGRAAADLVLEGRSRLPVDAFSPARFQPAA